MTRTATGISGAGLHGITHRVSGLTGKVDVGGGLSTNHSLTSTSPICINLSYHYYHYFLPPHPSKVFKVFSASLAFVGRTFRRDVFTDYGAGPELLGLIRYCTQYVCTRTQEISNRKICCQSDHTKVDGALRRKLVSRGLLIC